MVTPDALPTAFPTDALPEPLAAWVAAIAWQYQTDSALPAVACLAALSTAVGGTVTITPRQGWTEAAANLYLAAAADPAERKSPVLRDAIAPLREAAARLVDATARDRAAATRRAASLRTHAETLAADADKIVRLEGPDTAEALAADARAAEALAAADAATIPPAPVLLIGDATPEALVSTVAAHPAGVGLITDEAGAIATVTGHRYGGTPNTDPILQSKSNGPMHVTRRSAPDICADRPVLTVGVLVQPEPLADFLADPFLRARGLPARFQVAFPPARIGDRHPNPEPATPAIVAAYADTISALVHSRGDHRDEPSPIGFTPAARDQLTNLLEWTEGLMRPGGFLADLRDYGGKWCGDVVRLATLLALTIDPTATEVDAAALDRAATIGRYFMGQAVTAHAAAEAADADRNADYVWTRIRSRFPDADTITAREVYRVAITKRIPDRDALRDALDRLVLRGYLTELDTDTEANSRRSIIYRINAAIGPTSDTQGTADTLEPPPFPDAADPGDDVPEFLPTPDAADPTAALTIARQADAEALTAHRRGDSAAVADAMTRAAAAYRDAGDDAEAARREAIAARTTDPHPGAAAP
ncbi:DUF3987 domain-containing protein [Demequina capsici]|uniref:DUF3987 domain-containing protein n=1 Tax=Demequina capsici TaxID=3075620 RepID=A0AA96FDR5_9MICO|nr:DUF3987 domain-containing protein [Demequina sp. PMTSA13]WNM28088.1 DUF3987 domain-containing protein [Demequina sp. PMTSA13]